MQYIESQKKYITCSRDGTIVFWHENLKPQRKFPFAGRVKSSGMVASDRWIYDFVYMEPFQKIAMSSDDHNITFYG